MRVEAADAGAVGDGAGAGDVPAAEESTGVAGDVADGVGGEILLLAEAYHEDAAGAYSSEGVDEGHFRGLASDFAVVDKLADGSTEGLVNGAGGSAGTLDALEEVDYQRGCIDFGCVFLQDSDVHGLSPMGSVAAMIMDWDGDYPEKGVWIRRWTRFGKVRRENDSFMKTSQSKFVPAFIRFRRGDSFQKS